MDYYKDIEIKNFRAISQLHLGNLSKVNLFIGKNNVGKSTALESVFLLSGMSNPQLPESINKIRGVSNFNDGKLIFHNFDLTNTPEFYGKMAYGSSRSLRILPVQDKFENAGTSVLSNKIKNLELSFSLKSDEQNAATEKYKSTIEYTNEQIASLKIPKAYKENLFAIYLAEQNNIVLSAKIAELIKKKKEERLIEFIKNAFRIQVNRIIALPEGIFFDMDGVGEMVPLSLMGEGVKKVLNIIAFLESDRDSIFCIDEIENGLHYSVYKDLWEYILSVAGFTDSQFFITTHSIEVLKCLKEVLEGKDEKIQNSSRIVNLENTKNKGLMAYNYSYEEFKLAIDHAVEIRGGN